MSARQLASIRPAIETPQRSVLGSPVLRLCRHAPRLHPAAGTGDDEARARGTQKTVLERVAPPTFPLVIEMRERANWVTHWVEDSVDCLLHGKVPIVQARLRFPLCTCSLRPALASML